MARLLSGKVKVTSPTGVSTDRYEFLQLSEAEPNLGVPSTNGYVLTSQTDGTRSWTELSTTSADEHFLPVMTRSAQGTGSKNDAVIVTISSGINIVTGRFGTNVNVTENALIPFRQTVGITTHSLIETFFNTVA